MDENKIITEGAESTVVARYEPLPREDGTYQTEAALEQAFIAQLRRQAYEYLPLHTERDLTENLRTQLEALNGLRFTDAEWHRFFATVLAHPGEGIVEKTARLQGDCREHFRFDDGHDANLTLFDKQNVYNNRLQVVNQYVPEGGLHDNRYDVTLLVNGLPLVHVELKRRGVPVREAFNQIRRYQRESFWSGSGLFEYVQLFVISNGTQTKYYSNTTRAAHVRSAQNAHPLKAAAHRTSNSFEFTSWWADEQNTPITDLRDFTRTSLSKHTLLNVLAKYCVFTSEKLLLVMRPYQICAVEKILNRIAIAHNYHLEGTTRGGGYIWHTTGSGKTLTSFKAARLASRLDYVDKVVFVVDRQDLDYQTMAEYDRFERGAANSNTSSHILRRQLADTQSRLVITTIQKLAAMLRQTKHADELRTITQKHIVFIFDECHRSQFGEMHTAITRRFKRYNLFGFTGTPIFSQNAGSGGSPLLKTTEQAFGERLHTYTIVDAIRDRNVLPFRVEYVATLKEKKDIENAPVWSINTEKALKDPRRISLVTQYILKHFDQKTKRTAQGFAFRRTLNVGELASAGKARRAVAQTQTVRLIGFNALFAVSSIEYAKLYYDEFRRQASSLKVATIFSYGVNAEEDLAAGLPDEDSESTAALAPSDRDFLDRAIADYNRLFDTNYDTSAEKFQNYYKDVSLRLKNRELDLLIVVNMFLTGFDATTLNTLWVDKPLRMHGLLQAYSRTNRILNSVKTYGNIVCFRNLEKATNEALSLFGNPEAHGMVLLKTYREYYDGYTDEKGNPIMGYRDLVDELTACYEPGAPIASEQERRAFVRLVGALLRVQNILQAFDRFENEQLLTPRQMQDYLGMYNDIYQDMHPGGHEPDDVNDDLVFEMELVKQVEIDIDYILSLVRKYKDQNEKDRRVTLKDIERAVSSSPTLRNKRDLVLAFVASVTPRSNVDDDWNTFVRQKMAEETTQLIAIEELNDAATRKFLHTCFARGYVETSGTSISKLLPPLNPFSREAGREARKESVARRLRAFFDRFYSLVGPPDTPADN